MINPRAARFARRGLSLALILAGAAILAASGTRAAGPQVVVLPTTGIVDNVMAGYLAEGIAAAHRDGAAAVIIELNTPGGALDATQRIVTTLLEAPLPTIVWVAPAGAWAASAGTFITLAGHVAIIAPVSNIGAASPVGSGGEDIPDTLGEKVRNNAIASITSIAEARGRNVEWAIATVAEAKSSPASEALEVGAIDAIAGSLDEVLAAASGRTVEVAGSPVTLALVGATTREAAMNPFQGFLHLLSDPNIAFILFTIGFYGLLFELQNPNFVTGILGALAIIHAFIGFGSLPLNVAGLLLIGLGIILFVLEFSVTSHGLLTIGGLACFVLGASALFTTTGDPFAPAAQVALPLLVVSTATTAAFMFAIAWAAVRSRRMAAPAGGLVAGLPTGTLAVVRLPLVPLGSVHAAGEEWTARSENGASIDRDAPVRVVGMEGLTVVVRPEASSSRS